MALSADLRERVLAAHERRGGSRRVLAERFGVAVGTVNGWVRQARTGRRASLRHGGGHPPAGRDGACGAGSAGRGAARRHAGQACRDAGRADRAAVQPLGALPGAAAGWPAAEEKTLPASEQERPDIAAARSAWRDEVMGAVDPARLVSLDESGLNTRLTHSHARALRGQRALGRIPGGHWRRLTILGAIARDGLVAVMTIAAATGTAVFLAFVEQVLIPALRARPAALVAMDNLAPHRAAAVRAALQRTGLAHR